MFWASTGSFQCKEDLVKALDLTERSQINHTSKSEESEKRKNLSCTHFHHSPMAAWKDCHQFFFYYYELKLPNIWENLQVCLQTVTVTTTQMVKMDCTAVATGVMIRLEQTCNNCKILGSLTDKMTTKSHLSSHKKESTFPKITYKSLGLPQKTWPIVGFSKAWIVFKNNTEYIQ